jgi:BirA family biotin operon repressor/biotin-[acetyl-CoA-carboxylase] ligase
MTDAIAPSPLNIEALRAARTGSRFGAAIHYCESVDSTNTAAQRLARQGAPEGTVVIAEAQTQGRGRLGRSWSSPPYRNLYMSIVLRPSIALAAAPQLALVTGAAVALAIRQWTPRASLKWPNDVLIDGRKVCGILAEMDAADDSLAFVVAGIGVNLNIADDELPEELRAKAIGLCSVTGVAIDRVVFTSALLAHLETLYNLFIGAGFAAIRPRWEALSSFLGCSVEIDDGTRRHRGVALGLADDGTLRLRLVSGEEMNIVAGDVSVVNGYAAGR